MAASADRLVVLVVFAIILGTPTCLSVEQTVNLNETERIQEFVAYFSNPLVTNPLKKFVQTTPGKSYAYFKAAEFAVTSAGQTLKLRQILDVKEHGKKVWFRLLIKEKAGRLREATCAVEVSERLSGSEVSYDVVDFRVATENGSCDTLSRIANCSKCGFRGICEKGTAKTSPWLAFALKTQRMLQLDIPVNQVQMISAHNAFNARSEGYGVLDDCSWPPPYKGTCVDLANQEFSFTDQLDMGVRAMEIDPWWCFDRMRMSHADGKPYLGCAPWDAEFEDGIEEIGQWINRPENANEVIRLYFEDGKEHTQGHDDLINGPIAKYLGDKVLTPTMAKKYFPNQWPTPRQMLKLNKTVFIAAAGETHGGEFIFSRFWQEFTKNEFVSHANCSEIKLGEPSRVYCDSTEYGPFWNGPKETGVILDFSRYLKCGVTYPAADQINPNLLKTSVFTWAVGQPQSPLTPKSCVVLRSKDERWYIGDCGKENQFACVSTADANKWVVGMKPGPYSSPSCPSGFEFSVPHNGLQNQKLIETAVGTDVWLNFTTYVTEVSGNV